MTLSYRKPQRPTVYESAIDRWIAALLLASPFLTIVLSIVSWIQGEPRDALILLGTSVFVAIVSAIFTLPCRYTIDEIELHVRCGLIAFRVPLVDITQIEKSHSWMSGPALSLKRVLVATPKKRWLLSPLNREDFILDLQHAVDEARSHNVRS
ncbi:MAG: PH domain-containing protein [Planctomycetota bacterium]